MNYSQFSRLVSRGETPTVDFKLTCEAFATKKLKDNAELSKDVCAMANNGNRTSYIVVGISDGGKSVKSVANKKLTDDNLQTLCRSAISPPPRVRLVQLKWKNVPSKHANTQFVVIRIGPNARRAFSLSKDFISYDEGLCYRKHEVWIRRGATCDIANPDEVARLVKGQTPYSIEEPLKGNVYDKLPRNTQIKHLAEDFYQFIVESGGHYGANRLVLPFGRVRCVWRVRFLEHCTDKNQVWQLLSQCWQYEHAVLLIVQKRVVAKALPSMFEVNYKVPWGRFLLMDISTPLLPSRILPANTTKASHVVLILSELADTAVLRAKLAAMLSYLDEDEDTRRYMRESRESINKNLRRWVKSCCYWSTGPHYVGKRPKASELGVNEFFDSRYGNRPLVREEDSYDVQNAKTILNLTTGKLNN